MLHIHHMNLQRHTGGGEVYTHAMTRAFAQAGARVTLYCHPDNRLWDDLAGERVTLSRIADEAAFLAALPREPALVVTQGPLSQPGVARILERHALASWAHMPITGTRSAEGFRRCHLVVTVSRYCVDLLQKAGLDNVYPEPMYGTTEAQAVSDAPVIARSPYHWDRRKARDVLLGALEPFAGMVRRRTRFEKLAGLTLGVVSLLSPIKQFPLLFTKLAPVLAAREPVRLEIFGNGGYAQVRDIRRALAPLGSRVRWWGYQPNVRAIYPHLDWLLAGLPEREALGLNVLEAQLCGTPVLAPDAPPFTETVLPGKSGCLYRDPREDEGADFARVLDEILAGRPRPDPRVEAAAHLKQFSFDALVQRTRPLLRRLAMLAAG